MLTLNLDVLTRTVLIRAHNGVRLRVAADQLGDRLTEERDLSSAARKVYYGVNGDLKGEPRESRRKAGSRGMLATRGLTTCV